jgi:hypothetical protein
LACWALELLPVSLGGHSVKLGVFRYIMTFQNTANIPWINLYKLSNL